MKRKILFVLFVLMTSLVFSKSFFRNRYFEMKVTVPVSVSNNTFGIFEMLQKEVVIDLSEIAKEMPKNGFDLFVNASPNYEVTLNINEKFIFGPRIGINMYGTANVSKSVFEFMGNGNSLNEPLDFTAQVNADLFAYFGLLLGVKIGKLRVGVLPQAFIPIYSATTEDVFLNIENSEDGKFHITGNGTLAMYSNLGMLNDSPNDASEIINVLTSGLGIDVEGYFGWDYSKSVALDFNYKVPIKAGCYKNKMAYNVNLDFNTSISDFINGDIGSEFVTNGEQKNESVDFKIYRPMKFNLALRYNPFENFLTFNALGGVGIYHPFMDDMQIYPEYFFAAKVSLIGLLSAQISTEYFDKCFSHRFLASINLRLVQLDAGVSVSSTNFLKAFQGTGLGAFVSVAVGF